VNAVKRYVACILERVEGATTGSKLFDVSPIVVALPHVAFLQHKGDLETA
jgi:hypothetical protein